MSLGDRIIELRTAIGLTQYRLAEEMEVSRQAVSKWESGQSVPDALHLIKLAEILDTDIEYLTTGRKTYGRRPPVVIKTVETVEKVVEKPVIETVESVVERIVEVPVVQYVEKPVVKKVFRTKYVRNPLEFLVFGAVCFALGILFGLILN